MNSGGPQYGLCENRPPSLGLTPSPDRKIMKLLAFDSVF